MSRCTHGSTGGGSGAGKHHHERTLCFECFRSGMERTRARREAWAQRALPFDDGAQSTKPLTEQALAHRRRMLEYLASTGRRRA
jgi:hypothetical protein